MSALLDPAGVLAEPDRPLSREEAAELLGEIDRWCHRTGIAPNLLGRMALDFGGYVGLLRKRGTARHRTAGLVRCFFARWPDGVPFPEREAARRAAWELLYQSRSPSLTRNHRTIGGSVADRVRVEAEEAGRRRAAARSIGGPRSSLAALEAREVAPPPTRIVDRDPCPYCAVRGDIGCVHRPLEARA